MLIAVAGLMLTLTVGAPVDVTGKWDGTLSSQRQDGTTAEDSALLILTQKGGTITGTVGGNEGDQHPITNGTIEGNKVTLLAKHAENGREYRLELTVATEDEMKGTLSSGERRAQLVLKRRKEK